jgi:N utilization substance protein A
MNESFMEELDILEREKGVSKETILDALANALVSAYKRSPGAAEEARVTIDQDTGEIKVYGQELDEDGNVTREWEDTPSEFGRIGAQTAKQVILQRLRDAKRAQVFDLYEGRDGDLVTGIVQQSDHRTVILDLGNAEAVMPFGEKIPYERLERGARVKALIIEVRGEEAKGPQIVVSRSHPDFIPPSVRARGARTGRRHRRDQGDRPRCRPPHQDRGGLERPQCGSHRSLRRRPRRQGAPGGQRAAG